MVFLLMLNSGVAAINEWQPSLEGRIEEVSQWMLAENKIIASSI
jgi:hypothetical protein